MKTPNAFRNNNFDLIRLVAASQVAFLHAMHFMSVEITGVAKELLFLLHIFPGVPIFFFVSGYLISKSYESNSKISEYASNRILRLYPALFVAVTLSFVLIALSGYMFTAGASLWDWSLLYIAKTTFVQFYNPDFMRSYGDGVLNGSLWTITVEIQFYILVPILYSLFRGSKLTNLNLILIILCFFTINRVYSSFHGDYGNEVFYKLISVSFLPWFYLFLTGVFFQRNFDFFHKLLANKFGYLLFFYAFIGFLASQRNANFGNNINPLFFVLLAPLVFSCAYSFSGLAKKTTRGNDFSYGIYIYHMPIVNFLLALGLYGSFKWSAIALILTTIIAIASWFAVEKPCLKLKNHPFNPMKTKKTANLVPKESSQ